LLAAIVAALDDGEPCEANNAWLALVRVTYDNDPAAIGILQKYWAKLLDHSGLIFTCQSEGVPISPLLFQKIEETAESIDPVSLVNVATPRDTKPATWAQWLHAALTDKAWLNNENYVVGNLLADSDEPLPPEPDYPIPEEWKSHYLWMKFEHQPNHNSLADLADHFACNEGADDLTQLQWQQSWPVRAIRQGGAGIAYFTDVSVRLRKGLLGGIDLWRESQKNWRSVGITNIFGPNWDSMPWDPIRLPRVPPITLVPVWRFSREESFDPVDAYRTLVTHFKTVSNKHVETWMANQAVFYIRVIRGAFQVSSADLMDFLDSAPETLAMLMPRPKSIRAKDWHYAIDKYASRLDSNWLMPPEFILSGYTRKDISLPLLSAVAKAITEEAHGFSGANKGKDSLIPFLRNIPLKNDEQTLYVWLLELYAGSLDPENDVLLIALVQAYVARSPWVASSFVHAVRKGQTPLERAERLLKSILPILSDDQPLAAFCISMLHSIAGTKKTNIESPNVWARLGFGQPLPSTASNTPKNLQSPSSVVRIKEIELANVGRIESLKLEFPEPKSRLGQWIVLLGQNGAGKSTILRSIAVGLRDVREPSIWPSRSFTREWIRVEADGTASEGKIRIVTDDQTVTTYIVPAAPPVFHQKPEFVDPLPILIFAYGCRRGSATGGASREADLAEGMEIATLMDDSASLIHAENWLKDLDGDAPKNDYARSFYNTVCKALCELLDLKSIWVASRRVWIQMDIGAPIPFSELSDGYLTSAGWFVDLLARWTSHQESKGRTLDDNFMEQMTGLVLIDELDLHLHPKWQVEIIRKTKKLLPRMSFVVTTHNPLTLVGADAGEIWHLEVEGDGVSVSQGVEPPLLLSGGQLYRRYFGIQDIYPSEIGRSMQRLSFLSGLPSPTAEELDEIAQHRSIVVSAGIPIEDDSGERNAAA